MPDIVTFDENSRIFRVSLKSIIDGTPLTGLTISSAGLIISTIADVEAAPTVYTQAGSTIETIDTLGTYAAPSATKCRFKLVDNTNHPGTYEIHLADARLAVANAKSLLVTISGASLLAVCDKLIVITRMDLQDGAILPGLQTSLAAISNVAV